MCTSINAYHTLCQAKFLVERIGLRITTKEVLEGLHLILAATLLEDRVAVASTFLGVHGVFLEDGVEHVGGVDLGAVGKKNGQ